WHSTSNNTNLSESFHAKINRYGTNLNLRIAIENNIKTFNSIKTHNKSGIVSHRSNYGIISTTKKSIKKATQKISKKRQSDEKS
ncbi:2322_t:CDS:2, partial [Gigaspora margarita]